MKKSSRSQRRECDVIIIGAGPAGLGVGIILKKFDMNYVILEKHSVGSSFKKWPKETRFISPSFTGNFFKMPDLNAISPETSPAFNLQTEHPSGVEFAQYLAQVSEFYELPIETNVAVKKIQKEKNSFTIDTNNGEYKSTFVIWTAGEYQYPGKKSFEGSELCTHYSEISSFSDLEGKDRIVIGGYESGFDSAVNLVKFGKQVTVLDSADYLDLVNSDSSYSLSPCTRDRIKSVDDGIEYHKKTRVKKVEYEKGEYRITTTKKKTFTSKHKPINCTGFASSLSLVEELFDFEENYPLLTEYDESTKTKNLFLAGPQVKHRDALFCFIYKFRQRFAIVAERIAKKVGISKEIIEEVLEEYKHNNFYLEDLSCCDGECDC